MIRYDDIKSVKAFSSTDRRKGANPDREKRTVYIRTHNSDPNAMPIIFNDFNSEMAVKDSEKVDNFIRFMNLLQAHVGEDVEIIIKVF